MSPHRSVVDRDIKPGNVLHGPSTREVVEAAIDLTKGDRRVTWDRLLAASDVARRAKVALR